MLLACLQVRSLFFLSFLFWLTHLLLRTRCCYSATVPYTSMHFTYALFPSLVYGLKGSFSSLFFPRKNFFFSKEEKKGMDDLTIYWFVIGSAVAIMTLVLQRCKKCKSKSVHGNKFHFMCDALLKSNYSE